jgi:hypothetical protein
MPTLVSPGVAVSVTDESQYGSAGPGTVPLVILATRTNKTNVSGTGYAEGTIPSNAGKVSLLTSQRDLVEMFGTPVFKAVNNTPVHGDETNEYGLMAAYSYLGLANRAYVLRADIDLDQLEPKTTATTGDPADGTHWLDLQNSSFGLFEYTGTKWEVKTLSLLSSSAASGTNDQFGVVVGSSPYKFYKHNGTSWNQISINYAQPHYNIPPSPSTGQYWLKTTTPNNGLKLVVKKYVSANLPASSPWVTQTVTANSSDPATASEGDIYAKVNTGLDGIQLRYYSSSVWDDLTVTASLTAPTGTPTVGSLWYNSDVSKPDLYKKTTTGGGGVWTPVSLSTITAGDTAPTSPSTNDVWIDSTDLENYPKVKVYDGSDWVERDVADQTTPNGVVFADLALTSAETSAAFQFENAPDPDVYPDGILLWNTAVSSGNVKIYESVTLGRGTGVTKTTVNGWHSYSGNKADGTPYMLRKAQRAAVVRALQAAANANTSIREEMTAFSLIAAPAYPELLDEMMTLNTDRKETAFIIVDTPMRLSPQATALEAWISGNNAITTGEDGLAAAQIGHQAAAYYPSCLTSDLSGMDIVMPASHAVLRSMAYNDQVAYPWFAPAGLSRGVVTNASNVGYINGEGEFVPVALTSGQRDTLYGTGSRAGINPITRFPGQGIYIWGQKTLQPFSSALDRVNVARLVAYLRERFDPLARPFIFEINDKITRANAKQVFDGFLADMMAKRAVYDFIVVCDETNNTPARIDRNELWIDVAIEPSKAAEFIYIPIRIVNTGELSA